MIDAVPFSTAPATRIIIGLIEHMGDIAACEPVARYLKINNPNFHIAWAVIPRYRELIDANPFIDETVTVGCLTDWIKMLGHAEYDQVVDLHVNYRICQHCRIPLVKRSGNPFVTAFDWFDHGALLEAFSVGAGLPRLSAQPRLYIGQEHVEAVNALELPGEFCVIHRKSNELAKDWTDAGWTALCATIRDRLGLAIVEVGAGNDRDLPPPLEGVRSLVNRLPILQTAEVLRRARMFVGIDSGPAHFANCLEVPGVVLLGAYNIFKKYLPYTGFYSSDSSLVKRVRNRVGPVSALSSDEVVDAVRYVLGASREVRHQRPAPGAMATSVTPWLPPREAKSRIIAESTAFDLGWYAVHYPEVFGSTQHPIDHYLTKGAAKGYRPGPDFDPAAYCAANPDVAPRGINPLLHYIDNGRPAGRSFPMRDRGPDGAERPTTDGRQAATISRIFGVGHAPASEARDDEMPRTFAFYLPQFHPLPENDWAHGPGFSEWHNVIKTKPLFPGHHQPRVPGELGFYDLRSEDVLRQQVKLAQQHGIDGFCFYYYYFQGRKLLSRPIENFVKSDIDAPFMCLWANENWTKRWDGANHDVIVAQHHTDEDDLLALRELVPLFSDRRYARVQGKPILLIYKTHLFPDISRSAELWREEILKHGFPGIYLVMVDDWMSEPVRPREVGFDASYEIPSNIVTGEVLKEDTSELGLVADFAGRIVDYPKFAEFHLSRPFPDYKRFRTVMLPWDNTPRYGTKAMVHVNGEGESYRLWLLEALLDTYRERPAAERLVFLHSWNEWCEGTYLEPDRKNGRFFLEQTRQAIEIAREAIGLSARLPPEQVGAELLKVQRAKDAGAFRVLASTKLQTHYAYRDLIAERTEAEELRQEVVHLRRRVELLDQDHAVISARAHNAVLDVIHQSSSWKLTRPLRSIVARLGRR